MKQAGFVATIAKPSELEIVSRLCRRAVGPGDYALDVLKETVMGAGLFLAWCGGELVGMTNFQNCIDGSGWLSMARTDPDWRRTGVAHFLQNQIVSYAKRSGITTLRLWVLSNNTPSIKACRTGGFNQVCEASHISQTHRVRRRPQIRRPLGQASETQYQSLLQSKHLARMNGYFAYKSHFVKASKKLINLIQQKGELYAVDNAAFILTRPTRSFGELRSSLALLTGGVRTSFRRAKTTARKLGAHTIGGYVPYNVYTLDAARLLGFRRDGWGRHCLVFERTLL